MALLTNINGKFSVSDAGAVTFNNAFTFPTTDGAANYVLQTNGSGQLAWALNGNGDISGSGTANTVTKFTGSGTGVKTIGDGPITFSGDNSTFTGSVGVGTSSASSFYPGTHNLVVGDGGGDHAVTVYSGTTSTGYLLFSDGTSGSDKYRGQVRYDHNTDSIEFATNGSSTARLTINSSGNATFAGDVLAEDNLYLTDAGTVRGKIQLNSSDRDNLDIKAISLGSLMRFYTVDTLALTLDASQNANFAGDIILQNATPKISLIDTDAGDSFSVNNFTGNFVIKNDTDNKDPLIIDGANNATFSGSITTTSASGIKIDTTGNAILELDGASGSTEAIIFRHSGTEASRIAHSNSTNLVFSTGSSVTTALTLSGTNATFAGTVTAPTFSGDLNGTINTVTTATTKGNSTNDTTVATTAFVQNVIGTIPAGLVFQGTWNADTNSPTLTSGSGTTGNFYIVSVAGSTNLDGITDWQVGDWAVFIEQGASDQWEKIDNSSVLGGSGTGGSFAGWSGSGTSVTLGNAPVTFSGNNSTFAGQVNVNSDFKVNGSTGEDSLTIAPQAAGSGVFLLSLNAAGSAYEPFRVDAENYNFTTAGTSVISTSGLNTTFAGNVSLGDDKELIFGAATDYKIYHNSTTNVNHISSLIDRQLSLNANNVFITNQANSENMARFIADAEVKLYYDNVQKFQTTSTGIEVNGTSSTFAGTVTATGYSGPGQGLDNLLSLGAYATTPASTGILIATNIVTNDYAFIFGTIKLQRFHVSEKQTIEFSVTALNTGVLQSYQATSDVAITFKIFNYNGYWYLHFPMPAHYTTATAFINTGSGYQGQAKGFNEVSSISMNAVPSSGVTNSVNVVSDVYLTTGTSSPWLKNGNDIYNSNSGNVGIGTDTPAAGLQVALGGLSIPPAGGAQSSAVFGNATSDDNYGLAVGANSNGVGYISSQRTDGIATTYNLAIQPNGGNVGIGNAGPTSQLQVGPGTSNADRSLIASLGGTENGVLSALSLVNTSGNDVIGYGVGIDFHLASTYSPTGRIATIAEDTSVKAGMAFYTYESGGLDERMRIDSSGRVGIGVTPSYANVPLHTKNIGGGNSFNIFEGIGNAWVFGENDDTGTKYCQVAGRYGHHSGINVDLSGNVGIGTSSPATKLHVESDNPIITLQRNNNGNASGALQFRGSDNVVDWQMGTNQVVGLGLEFNFQNSNKVYIETGGNVGIGTTSPTNYKLEVSGNVKGDSFGNDQNTTARIFAPSGAAYNGSGTQTGYLIIKLPDNGAGGVNNMMSGLIRVFDYAGNESFDVHFAGYWYSGYNWTNCTAWIESQSDIDRNFNVRFGAMTGAAGSGTRPYITIGEGNSTWSYCKFSVMEYTSGHSNAALYKWNSGWEMDLSSTAPGVTARTATNCQGNNWARNGQDVYYGSGTGNVGIGTTSPLHNLQIGTEATNGSYSMMIEGNFGNTALSSNPRLNLIDTNFGITAGKYGSGTSDDAIGIFAYQGAGRGILFAHTTAGSGTHLKDMRHDMFVDGGTGNVGIGTTSPGEKLEINTAAQSAVMLRARYNASYYTDYGSNQLNFTGSNQTFDIKNNGTSALFINSASNVGIGDTLPTSLSANTSSLTVNSTRTDLSGGLFQKSNGVVKFHQYWTTGGIELDLQAGNYRWRLANVVKMALVTSNGSLTVVGDVVAYGSPSDIRLKENIKPIESALDKVSKLQGVTFDWKKSDSILDIKEDIGFIAQDVQKVIPELVRENEDGMLSMRHQGIAPILLEAIKELKAEIEELKKHSCDCKE